MEAESKTGHAFEIRPTFNKTNLSTDQTTRSMEGKQRPKLPDQPNEDNDSRERRTVQKHVSINENGEGQEKHCERCWKTLEPSSNRKKEASNKKSAKQWINSPTKI